MAGRKQSTPGTAVYHLTACEGGQSTSLGLVQENWVAQRARASRLRTDGPTYDSLGKPLEQAVFKGERVIVKKRGILLLHYLEKTLV